MPHVLCSFNRAYTCHDGSLIKYGSQSKRQTQIQVSIRMQRRYEIQVFTWYCANSCKCNIRPQTARWKFDKWNIRLQIFTWKFDGVFLKIKFSPENLRSCVGWIFAMPVAIYSARSTYAQNWHSELQCDAAKKSEIVSAIIFNVSAFTCAMHHRGH